MKSLTVLELSKLYGINRQTIYNSITKGILSKNSDNKIDLSEAIRVFGEPSKKIDVKDSVKKYVNVGSQESAETSLLRQQIDILKAQLLDAKEREGFYQSQIEVMQRLLAAPQTKSEAVQTAEQAIEPKPTAQQAPEPNKITSKRGLLSRLANRFM